MGCKSVSMMTAESCRNRDQKKEKEYTQKKRGQDNGSWNHNRPVDMAEGIGWPSSDNELNLLTIVVVEGKLQVQNVWDSLTV